MNNTIRIKRRSPLFFTFLATLASFFFLSSAYAIPTLQLDIEGGFYVGGAEESVTTSADIFTVYALGLTDKVNPTDTYYLSVAITPKEGPAASDLGSFTFQQEGGTVETVVATADMIYGNPPLTATGNPKLGGHGIFETFYIERSFTFDGFQTATAYNVEDSAGANFDISGSGLYYIGFEIDMSLFDDSKNELHFDLYNTKAKNKKTTVDDFAPFSHDAGTTAKVPEPSSAALLVISLIGFVVMCKRNMRDAIAKN